MAANAGLPISYQNETLLPVKINILQQSLIIYFEEIFDQDQK